VTGEISTRVRLRYSKTGRIRYTSQRDMARAWERALRRAHLPIAYSEGFSPRPLLSFSLALPTGCESSAEYIDLRFREGEEGPTGVRVAEASGSSGADEVARLLSDLVPPGIEIESAAALDGAGGSLQEQVTSCSWSVEVTQMSTAQLTERVDYLLAAATVPIERERKGRRVTDDLRPSILRLEVVGPGEGPGVIRLDADLATKPRGVRPGELLGGISPQVRLVRARRTAQWIDDADGRQEPLTRDGRLPTSVPSLAAERS